MLLRIASIVFPIFIIVMVGFAYASRFRTDMRTANALNMQVFLPALIFTVLAGRTFNLADNSGMALGCLVVVLASGILTWPAARLLGFEPKTLVPPAMFSNVGNMGLPLLLLTFGQEALGAAVMLMLVVTVAQFLVSSWMLGGRFAGSMLWREPLMVASLLGVACSLCAINVWPPLMVAIKLLGDISIGLMIFALGVRLSGARPGAWRIGLAGAIATPVTGMLAAWVFCAVFPLHPMERDILFVFGALPPAVSNFIFAERYQQEPEKVASIVLIGNALALFFIPLALALRL